MLFTLKKIIATLLMPLSIGYILFFIGLYYLFTKYHRKAGFFLLLAFFWLGIIGYSPFSNALIQPLENQYKSYMKIDKELKYVLVLGSGHVTNDEMSKISQLSKTALMRLSEGIRIYKQLNNGKLIVSGYEGSDSVPHALVLKDVAISLGIPARDIITQAEAKDTQEEAELAKKTVNGHKFILVTSASHMPRAMKIFETESLKPIAAPTNYMSKSDGNYLSVPNAGNIKKTEAAMHEYIGILWHTLIQKIRLLVN